MNTRRVELLGVPVDCLTMRQAVQMVEGFLEGEHPEAIIAVNPEKVMTARDNPELLSQMMCASLLVPDGIGVTMAVHLKNQCTIERVAGADLLPEICSLAQNRGDRVFLFGGRPHVTKRSAQRLQELFPRLQIVGTQHGYVSDEDMPLVIKHINDSGADILFLALGSPKQEQWMASYLPKLNVKVCQGVGGTFDVLSGTTKRAPRLWQRIHLEWFYRLLQDPRRWLRQVALPHFAFLVLSKYAIRHHYAP